MAETVRLTDRHLLNTIAKFPPEIQQLPDQRSFYLSLAIVKHFLGEAWCDQHLQPDGSSGFLRLDMQDSVRAEEQSFRLLDLAELFWNLQHVDGFDTCIARMRQGVLEATYAELDLGRMLYVSNVEFRFVVPSGKLGDDFDIEMKLSDGLIVCADAKCKIETTDFSPATVLNTLKDARKKLPENRPSILFVKVPSQWFKTEGVGQILFAVAKSFMRTTRRVVSVKFFVSTIEWENGHVTHTHRFQEISNPSNKFDPTRDWDIFAEADETATPEQGNFSDVPPRWRRLVYYPQPTTWRPTSHTR
jgi:hypothetical protein